MKTITSEEIKALNFCIAHAQTRIQDFPAYDGTRQGMQKQIDKAKTAIGKLRSYK